MGDLYLLKKQKKHGQMKFLSEAEKRRLGFYFSDEDIMEESGSESNLGEEGELDLEDEVDPYDRGEALRLKRALKKEQSTVKLEDEAKNRVAKKRKASEDLTHDVKRQQFEPAPNKEE